MIERERSYRIELDLREAHGKNWKKGFDKKVLSGL